MERKQQIVNLLVEQGILPLYFHPDAEVSIQILKSVYDAGVRAVEYTNRGETAIDNFLRLKKFADTDLPGLYLGAGTIRNKIEATEFINEGADFIVSPGVTEVIAALADKNDLLWVPGCLTATELMLADELGAQLVKLFPGNLLGPSYLAAMKEIFPGLLFMPTGGIETSEENLSAWFRSGASVVGMGSKLISKGAMETMDFKAIQSLTRQTLETIQTIKVV